MQKLGIIGPTALRSLAKRSVAVLAAVLVIGCASERAIVTTPPTVVVGTLTSVSFWPNRIEFDARVQVRNNDSEELQLRKVEFAVDLFDQELFTDTISRLRHTGPRQTLSIPFPFHIAMNDVMAQAPEMLDKGTLRVALRGRVFPAARYGMEPIPFSKTLEIPMPSMPEIAFVGMEGEPSGQAFRVTFRLTNTSPFPFTLSAVKTFLVINDKKYPLLHTLGPVEVAAGQGQNVTLQMETTPGKTLAMTLNLAENPHPTFNVTGTATCSTPYGWMYVPIDLEDSLN